MVGVGLKRSAVGEVTTFEINGELSPEDVVVRIVDPDGKPASIDMKIVRIHPGLLRCEYKTRKVRTYGPREVIYRHNFRLASTVLRPSSTAV